MVFYRCTFSDTFNHSKGPLMMPSRGLYGATVPYVTCKVELRRDKRVCPALLLPTDHGLHSLWHDALQVTINSLRWFSNAISIGVRRTAKRINASLLFLNSSTDLFIQARRIAGSFNCVC